MSVLKNLDSLYHYCLIENIIYYLLNYLDISG